MRHSALAAPLTRSCVQLLDYEHRSAERASSAQDQDFDEDEAERLETLLIQEDDVLCTYNECVCCVLL